MNSIKSISSIHDINISENDIVDTISIHDIVNIHSISIMHFLDWYLYIMYICTYTYKQYYQFICIFNDISISINSYTGVE